MRNFKEIRVPPIVHINTKKFIGIRNRGMTVGQSIQKDMLIMFETTNELRSWNIFTGKLLSTEPNNLPFNVSAWKEFSP